MITLAQSLVHLCGAAALSAGLLSAGVGRRRARPLSIVAGVVAVGMTFYVANAELKFTDADHLTLLIASGSLALVAIGVVLLRLGLGGQRIGDHPHCRACGFDLTGRPETTRVCNECGVDLEKGDAIVVGRLERRRVPLVAGAFLGVLGLAIGTASVRSMLTRSQTFAIVRWTPTAWLIDDLFADAPTHLRASNELLRRMVEGSLSAAHVRDLTIGASGQRLRSSQISRLRGLFIDRAWALGQLDEKTLREIVAAEAGAILEVSRSSRAAIDYRIRMPDLDALAGSTPTILWVVTVVSRLETLDGAPLPASTIEDRQGSESLPTLWSQLQPWAMWANRPAAQRSVFGSGYTFDPPLASGGERQLRIEATINVSITHPNRPTIDVMVPIDVSATVYVNSDVTARWRPRRPTVMQVPPNPTTIQTPSNPGESIRTTVKPLRQPSSTSN